MKDTTLVVLLHPDVCEACMQERSQWMELFERHCDGLQMIGVVFGVADLEELGAFEEYLGLPFPLFWDEKEVLRRAYAEDPEAALPYKLLVAQDGTVLERWNRDRGLRGAGEDR